MRGRGRRTWWGAGAVALAVAAGACSSGGTQATGTTSTTRPTSTTAQAAPTSAAGAGCGPGTTVAGSGAGGKEVNPPGDIPDNQAFVAFSPPSGGYTVKVPEGWARADGPDGVRFTDKFNSVLIRLVPAPAAPTPASAQAGEVPAVAAAARCFELGKVTTVTRRAGPAVLVTYRADSAPDPVTGKVVRDDVERYELWRSGTEAVLTLSGPAGSDNVDPWRMVTDSFAWR